MYTKHQSSQIFEHIAKRYDFVNCLLSFCQDRNWRAELVKEIPRGSETILDLATGTGGVAIEIKKQFPGARIFGVDPSERMLELAKKKAGNTIEFQKGSAERLPFDALRFDAVTISFGIRNFENVHRAFAEVRRVLRPKGAFLILEFSKPQLKIIRLFHFVYLRFLVPLIGFLFTGNLRAYLYLSKTIESFPSGKEFVKVLQGAGFTDVSSKPIMFGAVTIYKGFV